MDEFKEYVTFTVTSAGGEEVEMAVLEEFEFERKTYAAAAKIEGDSINEDGVYIYRTIIGEEDFNVEKIEDKEEYEKVVKAYMEM